MESVYGSMPVQFIFSDKYFKALNLSAKNGGLPGERVHKQFVLNYVVELNLINFCGCMFTIGINAISWKKRILEQFEKYAFTSLNYDKLVWDYQNVDF